MPSHPHTRLDPRDPLVIDTRELGRRPGSMRRLSRSVPAPAGLGLEFIAVPQGADLALDVRLEAVMEGVLVTGTARVVAEGECGRCLDPVAVPLEVEILELYAYPGHEVDDDAEDVGRLDGDFIPLEQRLRDAVVLALPLRPVCSPDCPGLCATCGARLAEEPAGHTHEQLDSRWSALQGLQPAPELALGQGLSNTDDLPEER
jgi:uncharacterized protein